MAIPKGPGMGVRQRIANAANLGRNIARKPISDPTGQGLKGKTLTGGAIQIKRNVGTKVPERRKKGGIVKSSAQTSVIKGAKVRGSREGSTIKGPKAKGSREGSVIKASKGTHVTKDGRTVKKGLYYYMIKRKKAGTSRKGKGTVSAKALKQSAKTAFKTKKKT